MTRAVLVAVIIASLVHAQESAPPPRSIVSGVVINGASGEPVRRATVILKAHDEDKGMSYLAESDGNGRFLVEDIVPGGYSISADRQGFFPESGGASGAPPPSIKVEASKSVTDVKIKLLPFGVITGRVLDEDGEPVRAAFVTAMTYAYGGGKRQLRNVQQVQANDKGEFRLFSLRPGSIYLSGATVNPPRLDRFSGFSISRSNATYFPSTNDIAHATPIDIAAGAQLRGFDIRLRREASYSVRGKLPSEVKTQDGRRLMLQILPVGGVGRRVAAIRSGDDQTFEFMDLLPGSYVVAATLQDGDKKRFARQPIEVVNADVEGVTLSFSPGIDLSGSVRVEGTPRKPLDKLQVLLRAETTPQDGASAEVKPDGSFEMKDTPQNVYRVVLGNHPGIYLKTIKFGDEEAPDMRVDLTRGSGPLTVVLGTDVGEMHGTVKKPNGDPAARVWVTLIAYGSHLGRADFLRAGFGTEEGTFHLEDVVPGDYKIFAWENAPLGAPQDPDFRKPFEKYAVDVKMEPNGHQSVELTSIPPQHSN